MTDAEQKTRDKLCQNAVKELIQFNRIHRRIVERRTADIGIHSSQHRMLMYISKFDIVPSQKLIADYFNTSSSAVTATLKKLERAGYIEKVKNHQKYDTRYNEIHITEKGRKEAESSEEYFRYIDTKVFDNFNTYEIHDLIALLEKVQQNLNNLDTKQSKNEKNSFENSKSESEDELN